MPKLITSPTAIWLAVEPVDMRQGIDGLSMIAQQALGKAPSFGAAIVFRNRLGNRIEAIPHPSLGQDLDKPSNFRFLVCF